MSRQGLELTISKEDSAWARREAKVRLDAYYKHKVLEALSTPGTILVRVTVERIEE